MVDAKKKKGYKISKKRLTNWLREEDVYQLHKPSRKTFPRRSTFVQGIDHLWQIDLSDVSSIKTYNKNYRFLLFVVDVFSKYGWVRPLPDKTGPTLAKVMEEVITTSNRKPLHIMSDKGGEFVNAAFKKLMKKYNINFYTSQNEETKAAFVERLQRTFKTKMFRFFTENGTLSYINVLQDIMSSYNNTKHSATKVSPVEVTKSNEKIIRKRLFKLWNKIKSTKSEPSIAVGDSVRLSIARKPFRKGYLPQWTEEIFTVKERKNTKPVTFTVEDYDGIVLEGTFYSYELQKVPTKADRIYRIEKILRRRMRKGKKEVYVKWVGYPKKFNSWILESELI